MLYIHVVQPALDTVIITHLIAILQPKLTYSSWGCSGNNLFTIYESFGTSEIIAGNFCSKLLGSTIYYTVGE